MDRRKLRTRHLQDEWPRQVGNLASILARMSSHASDARYDQVVAGLLHEGTPLIEWCAPNVPLDVAADLAERRGMVIARLSGTRDGGSPAGGSGALAMGCYLARTSIVPPIATSSSVPSTFKLSHPPSGNPR